MLENEFSYQGNLLVLTGLNGSGKTRLLESIQEGLTSAEVSGVKITNQEVSFLNQESLTPSFGGVYNDVQFQAKITASLRLYDKCKVEFDGQYNPNMAQNRNKNSGIKGALAYEPLYRLCNSIALQGGKKPSELTHDEIRLSFDDHVPTLLGFQNVSSICNQYIQRKKLNRYNKYCAEHENENVEYFSDAEFLKRFGEKPWLLLNSIIKNIFDDKFRFTEPDESSQSYTYRASLIQRNNNASVALSSGENTLLWLALTLFNSQYYDRDVVKVPRLLLLDEPDAFLHPRMVVKMYTALKEFSSVFGSKIIFTTHSPTTVALAPDDGIFVVTPSSVLGVTRDEGVAELLDGVTQISINPDNRRQVFVESHYDANTYQALYSQLLYQSDILDPKITLNFVSSGPKMPLQQIRDKVLQVLGKFDDSVINEFISALNGVGNCTQVIGQVEALWQNSNETVRGIIDWDLQNHTTEKVTVLGEGKAYSIENLALDPICILLLLHTDQPETLTMDMICGSTVHWSEWLVDIGLLQESVNRFMRIIFETENARNATLTYQCGKSIQTDLRYLRMKGHPLEKLVKLKYPALNAFARSGKEGELKYSVVRKSMINLTKGNFIPTEFESVLASVQK